MRLVRPSGQTKPTDSTTTATPPSPSSSEIAVGPNGRISGIDGMLDQIAAALVKAALPPLQQDRALQMTVGGAIGKEMAKPLWVLAGIAAVYVGYKIFFEEKRA